MTTWANDWRLALRVGAREVRRSWGRSTVIVTMVALPLILIAAALVVTFTTLTTPQEAVEGRMGRAQALIQPANTMRGDARGGAVTQNLDGTAHTDAEDRTLTASAKEVAEHFGGTAVPRGHRPPVEVYVGERQHHGTGMVVVDLRDPAVQPVAPLVEGRYPQSPDEVVVTRLGVIEGLPTHGTLGAAVYDRDAAAGVPSDPTEELTVVGVVNPPAIEYTGVIGLPGVAGSAVPDPANAVAPPWSTESPDASVMDVGVDATYLVTGERPVTWADVQWANQRGWVVASRAEITEPSAAALQGDQEFATRDAISLSPESAVVPIAIGATAVTLVLLQASLMAGPAFAVGYARQRRSLGLLASNGASRRQLTRYLSGQALVLGVITAAVAVALGVGLGLLAVEFSERRWPTIPYGPLDIPWLPLLGVCAVAILAVLVSALFPAVRVLRSDVATSLRTGFTTRRPARATPVIGLVLVAVTSAVVLGLEPESNTTGLVFALSLALLVVASLLAVPWLIHAAAAAGRHLAMGPRIALRDLSRQRMRTVPTVGAIIGAVVALVTVSMAGPAFQRVMDQSYYYSAPMGGGQAFFSGTHSPDGRWVGPTADQVDALRETASELAPGADLIELTGSLEPSATGQAMTDALGADASATDRLTLGSARCDAQAWEVDLEKLATTLLRKGEQGYPEMGTRCQAYSSHAPAESITLVSQDDLHHWSLPEEARSALERGEVVLSNGSTRTAGLVLAVPEISPGTASPGAPKVDLPTPAAHEVTIRSVGHDAMPSDLQGAIMLAERAEQLGFHRSESPDRITLTGLGSPAVASALQEKAPGWQIQYENGPTQWPTRVTWALAGLLLLLIVVASVIGAALRQTEAAADDATLAAIGAPSSVRRYSAVWHAAVAGALGTVIGVAVGLVPGIALSRLVTALLAGQRPVITWPQWWVAPVLVLAIALAALAAHLLVPRHPEMTMRRRP